MKRESGRERKRNSDSKVAIGKEKGKKKCERKTNTGRDTIRQTKEGRQTVNMI